MCSIVDISLRYKKFLYLTDYILKGFAILGTWKLECIIFH